MPKKKKKLSRPEKSEQRKRKAKQWLLTYNGTKVVRAYRKKFNVDTTCAIRELREIGYTFQPGYIENLQKAEAARLEQLRIKREEKAQEERQGYDFQNDMFYFIAGYTSGGAPYGVTWEEMGLEPYGNIFDEDDGEDRD